MAIELQIGADIRGAVNGLNQLDKSLKKADGGIEILKNQAIRLQKIMSMPDLSFRQYERLSQTLNRTQSQINSFSRSGLTGLSKGSNEATQSLLNLSRVAQDAPYGFIGIANNLNPLLESFQRLKATTGTTGGALKALGSSLMGAGGLGLALGVGSSLLVTFGDKLFGVGKSAERTKKEIESLTNALEFLSSENKRIGDDLDQTSRIMIANMKADGKSEQEIYEATNDALIKRRELLRGLQSDLSATAAKIQRTKGFDLDLFNEKLSTGQPLEGQLQKFKVVQDQQLKAEKDYYENEASIQILAAQNRERIRKENEKRLADQREYAKESAKIWKNLREEMSKMRIPGISPADTPVVPEEFDARQAENFQRRIQESLFKGNQDNQGSLEILNKDQIIEDFRRDFAAIGQEIPKQIAVIEGFGKAKMIDLNLVFNTNQVKAGLSQAFADIQATIRNISETMTQALREVAVTAFAGIGEAIGTAFAGGDVKSVFKNMFVSIGSIIQELGKRMIALSPLVRAIQVAISSFSPAGVLAAGVGMVALGAAVKTAFSKATPFEQGGLVFGPTLGLVGEGRGTSRSNPEVIAPLDKLQGYLQGAAIQGTQRVYVEGVVRGRDLALIAAREFKSQERNGGAFKPWRR